MREGLHLNVLSDSDEGEAGEAYMGTVLSWNVAELQEVCLPAR